MHIREARRIRIAGDAVERDNVLCAEPLKSMEGELYFFFRRIPERDDDRLPCLRDFAEQYKIGGFVRRNFIAWYPHLLQKIYRRFIEGRGKQNDTEFIRQCF